MGKTGFDLQDFLNYFLPGLCLLLSIVLPLLPYAGGRLDDLDSFDKGLLTLLLLNLAYVFGHFLEPFRGYCESWSYDRSRYTGTRRRLLGLLGRPSTDPRQTYFGDARLKAEIRQLLKGWTPPDDEDDRHAHASSLEVKNFYLCWRLLEHETPQGTRYHLRALAIHNFAATMVGAVLCSWPFLLWLFWQKYANSAFFVRLGSSAARLESLPSPCAWLVRLQPGVAQLAVGVLASLLITLVLASGARLFFQEYQKYHQEWVQNVCRSSWIWLRTRKPAGDASNQDDSAGG